MPFLSLQKFIMVNFNKDLLDRFSDNKICFDELLIQVQYFQYDDRHVDLMCIYVLDLTYNLYENGFFTILGCCFSM